MRRLIASTFVSLDGILQAPGGPEEDRSGGFAFGGWTVPFWDDAMGRDMKGFDGQGRELLLGRRTYEIFAAYWPYQPAEHPIARTFNATRKHVASRTPRQLAWHNAVQLPGEAAAAVAALKATPGPDLQVIGSGNLIQALRAAALIDDYNVWTFPLVLGRGKRLFEDGAPPGTLRLLESQVTARGVVMSTYVPAGPVQPGSFVAQPPSAEEVERRRRVADGAW